MVNTLLFAANNKTLSFLLSFLLSKEGLNPFEQAKSYGHHDILDDLEKAAAQFEGRLDKQQSNRFFGKRLSPCPLAVVPLAEQIEKDEEKESHSEADKEVLVP